MFDGSISLSMPVVSPFNIYRSGIVRGNGIGYHPGMATVILHKCTIQLACGMRMAVQILRGRRVLHSLTPVHQDIKLGVG